MKKKVLIALGVVLGLVALGVGIFIATFDLDEMINRQKAEQLPELEKALGRKVEIGEIRTTILPVLGAEIRDVVIAGRTPDEAPLVRIARVRFGVELWTALRSLGDEIRLRELVVEGLAVEIIREADGKLSYEDVLARLSEGPPPEEAPKPLSPEAQRFIRNLELQRIAVEEGEIKLVDRAAGTTATVGDLLVELTDVRLDQPFEVRLAAAVLAAEQNFDLRAKVGPVPLDDPDAALPVEYVTLDADGVDLAALAAYVPGGAPVAIQAARLSADWRIDDPLGAKGAMKSGGKVTLAGLAVGSPPGEAFDLVVEPNLTFALASGTVDLTGLSVALAEMKLTANGRITEVLSGRPAFHGLTLASEGLNFGRLFALLPPAKAALPPGAVLDGPFSIAAKADGDPDQQQIAFTIDLDPATVVIPDAVNKPAGTALHAALDAHLTRKDLDLKRFDLAFGPLALRLAGTVKDFADPAFDLQGGIAPTPIAGVVPLLPAVAQAVPADVRVGGDVALELVAKGTKASFDGKVDLRIAGADLRTPAATLDGSGRVQVSAKGQPGGAIAVTATSDLDGLAIVAGDTFRKPAGTALDIDVQAALGAGGGLDLSRAKLVLGPLNLDARGSRAASGALDMQVAVEPFAVGALAAILPALADNPFAAARVGMKAAVKGDPAKPATVEARLDDFSFAMGQSSLAGNASVKNLDAPVIRFEFSSPYLDLDALLPGGGEDEAPAEGGKTEVPDVVKTLDAAGSLRVARGRMADIEFTNFVATLVLRGGVLRFEKLDFDAYDGHFTAAPTAVDLTRPDPQFDLEMKLTDVDADAVLTDQANLRGVLSGRMSTTMDLAGRGLEWPTIRDSLTGDLGLALANGQFERLELGNAIVGKVGDKVPFLKVDRRLKTGLKDLAGQFRVADGRMTLVKPMVTRTGEGPLSLEGSIGLDKTLDLRGTLQLQPETVRAWSGGKLAIDKAMPVGLRIGGTLSDPEVSGIEATDLVTALVAGAAMAAGLGEVDEARRRAEEEARQAAERARAEAERLKSQAAREAAAVKRAAEEKKREAEAKARKEAEKAKAAAKKKAEEEAKKRLKGVF